MPLPGVWGPRAWELLHTIANRAGKGVHQRLLVDEQREIIWLFSHIEYMIPCPECRLHIIQYRKGHGGGPTNQFGQWIWNFHEAVNQRLGKNPGPSFTEVEAIGGDLNIRTLWSAYLELVRDSLQAGHLRSNEVKEWGRHLLLWCAFH